MNRKQRRASLVQTAKATPCVPSQTLQDMVAQAATLAAAGQLAEAGQLCAKAVAAAPHFAQAWCVWGIAALRAGQASDAEKLLEKAASLDPATAHAHFHLGLARKRLGKLAAAAESLAQACRLAPDNAAAWNSLGLVLARQGCHPASAEAFRQAVVARPDFADAACNLGSAFLQTGRPADALVCFERALELNPDHLDALRNAAKVLHDNGRSDDALQLLDRSVAANPANAEVRYFRGIVLSHLGQLARALACFDEALESDPAHAQAWYSRARPLDRLGREEEALASNEQALQLQPDLAGALYNRAVIQMETGHLDEAVAGYDALAAGSEVSLNALFFKGICLLLFGNWRDGLPLYESRKAMPEYTVLAARRHLAGPEWDGKANIAGKTIFIYWEQGFGDTIQFSRLVLPLLQRGARVVFSVQDSLGPVLRTISPLVEIIGEAATPPAFDCHAPLMSLPYLLGVTPQAVPGTAPWLAADPLLVAKWQQGLGSKRQLRIGLAWRGNKDHEHDRQRSLALAQLLPFLPAGCELVSLQKEIRDDDRAVLEADGRVRWLGDKIGGFDDTAALCTLVDLVVTVDTSVAHLAGALGRETWILLAAVPDWRWGMAGERTAWYSTVTLLRQNERGNWAGVLAGMRQRLERLAAGHDTRDSLAV